MIYFVCLLVGLINGFFASCAGQLLIFYLIFILNLDSYKSRAVSIASLALISIATFIGYNSFIDFDAKYVIMILIVSAISGFIGSKVMKKIPANILNLISGILLMILTVISFLKKGV